MKAEIENKKSKSFLPPSLVFYPTFLPLKFAQITCSKLIFTESPTLKKWGKKLVKGVKNFCMIKYEHSAFICTKNQVKIFKIDENKSIWKIHIQNNSFVGFSFFSKFQNFENFWKFSKIVHGFFYSRFLYYGENENILFPP